MSGKNDIVQTAIASLEEFDFSDEEKNAIMYAVSVAWEDATHNRTMEYINAGVVGDGADGYMALGTSKTAVAE